MIGGTPKTKKTGFWRRRLYHPSSHPNGTEVGIVHHPSVILMWVIMRLSSSRASSTSSGHIGYEMQISNCIFDFEWTFQVDIWHHPNIILWKFWPILRFPVYLERRVRQNIVPSIILASSHQWHLPDRCCAIILAPSHCQGHAVSKKKKRWMSLALPNLRTRMIEVFRMIILKN